MTDVARVNRRPPRTLTEGWSVFDGPVARHTDEVIHAYERAGLWGERSIFEVFEASVEDHADRTAVISGERRLTYESLHARTLDLARGMVLRGVGPGDVVVAQLPNCLEFVELSLACSRVGAYFCPVNVRIRSELEHILALTRSPLVIVPAEHRGFEHAPYVASLSPAPPPAILTVGGGGATYDTFDALRAADGELPDQPDPNGPWLVEFTSGTTAAPKGVIRTHNATLATLASITGFYGLAGRGDDNVVLAAQPVTFLFPYYFAVLMPLLNGLTSVVVPSSDPRGMLDAIEAHRVTLCALVPSMVEPLLEEHQRRGAGPTSLRIIQLAGAFATKDRKQRLLRQLGCDVLDAYGLTESCWPIGNRPDSPTEQKLETAGVLCDTAELQLLDRDGTPVETGQVGEILLRGPAQFPGYYADERATRAAIDPDGWFRTGDLAQQNEAGYIRIVGRLKEVIVHGGVNVSPSEVEELLYTHPGVRAAVVLGVPDEASGEAIWAVVQPVDHALPPSEDELREFLAGRLAKFKVPARVVLMDELPMSNVGKVRRGPLRAMLMEDAR